MESPFSTPEILVSLTSCPGHGLSPSDEEQRQFAPSEFWTVPLENWDDVRGYIEEQGFVSLSDFVAQGEENLRRELDNPDYLNALLLPRTNAIIATIQERLWPGFELREWHCPLLFGEPWDLGTPDDPPTLLSLMTKYERNCDQFAFFEARVLSGDRVLAVRHPARLMIARNEATGESVQCWHDRPKLCVAKVLTSTDEAIAAIEQVSSQNPSFFFKSIARDL